MDSINSSPGHSDYFNDFVSAKNPKNSALSTKANAQVANTAISADQIILDALADSGFELDNRIPEHSTVSFHV